MKVSGLIALVVIVLFVVALVLGGDHGPARHGSLSGGDSQLEVR